MRIFGTGVMVSAFMAVLGIGVYARLTGRLDGEGLTVLGIMVLAGLVLARVSGDLFALAMAAILVLIAAGQL
jgi:hypothetical protein